MVVACVYFRPYIEHTTFTVLTDHNNLRWLMQSEKTGKLNRWVLRLQPFRFHIKHKPGKLNVVPDTLSRVVFVKDGEVGNKESGFYTKHYEAGKIIPENCWRRVRAEYIEMLSETEFESGNENISHLNRKITTRQWHALEQHLSPSKFKRVWADFSKADEHIRLRIDEKKYILQTRPHSFPEYEAKCLGKARYSRVRQ